MSTLFNCLSHLTIEFYCFLLKDQKISDLKINLLKDYLYSKVRSQSNEVPHLGEDIMDHYLNDVLLDSFSLPPKSTRLCINYVKFCKKIVKC